MELPDAKTLAIDDIKPYFRNPRRIGEDAIAAVAESIERYGYQQPIVVDADNVIVVGHTRHLALQKLGYTEVAVYVTDLPAEKAKEYRLVDNRTAELSSWDYGALVMELREFETSLLESFFPDVDLEIGQVDSAVTQQQIDDASAKVARVTEANPTATHTTTVVCPACFHEFPVRTRSLPGLSHEDLDELAYADGQAE